MAWEPPRRPDREGAASWCRQYGIRSRAPAAPRAIDERHDRHAASDLPARAGRAARQARRARPLTGAAWRSWPRPREFLELLQREFPEQASELRRPRGPPRASCSVMGASLALAGLTGAARASPSEKIVPVRASTPEELVPGRPLFFATARARRRLRDRACWSRATWAGRPRSRATRSIPASLGAHRRLRPGRDPRPLRPRPLADDHATSARSAPGARFIAAMRAALEAQQARRRRRACAS